MIRTLMMVAIAAVTCQAHAKAKAYSEMDNGYYLVLRTETGKCRIGSRAVLIPPTADVPTRTACWIIDTNRPAERSVRVVYQDGTVRYYDPAGFQMIEDAP